MFIFAYTDRILMNIKFLRVIGYCTLKFLKLFFKGPVMILVGIICTQNKLARMRAKLFFLLYKNYIYIFFSFSV